MPVSTGTLVDRLAYRPRPDGPHARLGVVWFVGAVAACAVGTVGVAALFAAVAAVASMQLARAWQARGRRMSVAACGIAAAVTAPLAVLGPLGLGIGLAASVGVAVVGSAVTAANPVLAIRSSFLPALAVGSVVLTARTDMGALVVLLVLVSAYEVGDYLMGSDADGVVEGPVAGMAAVMVLTFTEAVLQLGPFETRAAWVFGALVAVLAPLGAIIASALAPSSAEAGTALRRLDAWLVVAPLWSWMLLSHLGRIG